MSTCIFCGGTEPHSKDLLVCGDCTGKFTGRSINDIKEFIGGHALTEPQLKFLHVPKEPEKPEDQTAP